MWTPTKQREYPVIGKVRFQYNGYARTVGIIEECGPAGDRLVTGYEFGRDNMDSVSGRYGSPIKSFHEKKMSNAVWE